MFAIIAGLLQMALALALSPLLVGIITKVKAFFGGRVGPPVLQPYYDLARLMRKGMVFSTTATWVFRAGPVVGLAATLLAAAIVPLAGPGLISFQGDVLLLAYLLALGRFFTASAALDTGSPFEGMGAVREVSYAALAEPALVLGLLVLAKLTGSLQLSEMLGAPLAAHWSGALAPLLLVLIGWFIVLLVENCRIPFDDPNTHLELTMIHEVMVLDHSGPALGMILYGAAIKLFVFGTLVARVLAPVATGWWPVDLLVSTTALLGVTAAVGVVESVMARLRLPNIPALLVASCLCCAFGVVLLAR
jgi:formate hydrogenlyase subunit 4